MADKKITELTALTTADPLDVLPIVDVSAGVTKKITAAQLLTAAKNLTFADSPYTVLATDKTLFVNAQDGDVEINFPASVTTPFRIISTVKIEGSGGRVNLNAFAGDNLNGAALIQLSNAFDSIQLQSNGVIDWYSISKNL